jgi:glutathione S-transferase
VVPDSDRILSYLEERAPDPPLHNPAPELDRLQAASQLFPKFK